MFNLQVLRAAAAATVAALAFSLASPAAARGVAVDTSGAWKPFSSCAEASPCAAYQLDFNIDVGKGLTNKVFVYADGFISIGSELAWPGAIATLTDLGAQDVVTPYYAPPINNLGVAQNPGSKKLDLIYGSYDYYGEFTYSEVVLAAAAGNPGAFTLTFREGDANFPPPIMPYPLFLGYQFGGDSHDFINAITNDYSQYFNLGSPGSGTPEPSVWALMLLGFGSAGLVLRRRRAAGVA